MVKIEGLGFFAFYFLECNLPSPPSVVSFSTVSVTCSQLQSENTKLLISEINSF